MSTPSNPKDQSRLKHISQVLDSEQINNLTHSSVEFTFYGIQDHQSIYNAVEKAIRILKNTHSDPQCHIQNVWLESDSGAESSWKLSDTAFNLILIDVAHQSPELSALVRRLAKRFLK